MHRNLANTAKYACDYGAHRRQTETLRPERGEKEQILQIGKSGAVGSNQECDAWHEQYLFAADVTDVAQKEIGIM
jgi:hypothetical protein